MTDRHPALARALWDPERLREISNNLEIVVNNAVPGVSCELDSELLDGDRIRLLGPFMVGA